MAALVCLGCGAVYSVGAEKCPQCGATDSRGDWEEPAPVVPTAASRRAKAAAPADRVPVADAATGGAD